MTTLNTSDISKNNGAMPVPCREWANKLAASHHDDLSPAERAALNAHVTTCTACATVRDEYRAMDEHILSLPIVEALSLQAIQPARLEEATNGHAEPVSLPVRPVSARSRIRLNRAGQILSAIAAVLVMGAIVGGFALLASTSRTGTTTGTAASPAVYVATDVSNSVAYAINPRDGSILWQHTIGHKLSVYPLVVKGLVIFAAYDDYLYAYHTNDGSFAWQTRVGNGINGFAVLGDTRVTYNGNIYFSTMDANFVALRTRDGAILWKKQISHLHNSTSLTVKGNTTTQSNVMSASCANGCMTQVMQADQGVVYAFDDGLYALKASDGSVIWHDPAYSFNSQSFAVVDGKIFTPAASNGDAIAVLQVSNGKVLHIINGFPQGQPLNFTVTNGVLYVLDQDLSAYRISDYTRVWHVSMSPCLGFDMTVSDGSIYVSFNGAISNSSGNSANICAFRTTDGSLRWQWHKADNEGVTQPIELNGVLYIAHNTVNQKLYVEAWSASDGHILWRVPFAAPDVQGPVVG